MQTANKVPSQIRFNFHICRKIPNIQILVNMEAPSESAQNDLRQEDCEKTPVVPTASENSPEQQNFDNKADDFLTLFQKAFIEDKYIYYRSTSPEQAPLIVKTFLMEAKKEIIILCGKLSEDVYGNLKNSFVEAMNRGVNIRVVTNVPRKKLQTQNLADILAKKDCIKCQTGWKAPHFIIVDCKHYRLEEDSELRRAIVCVNGHNEADRLSTMNILSDYFNTLWKA